MQSSMPGQQPLVRAPPDPALISVLKENLKRLEAAGYQGDLQAVVAATDDDEDALQRVEPTMNAGQFSTATPASVNTASKRMMSDPMGCSKPTKHAKTMRTTNSTMRTTKPATSQVWGGFKKVGC